MASVPTHQTHTPYSYATPQLVKTLYQYKCALEPRDIGEARQLRAQLAALRVEGEQRGLW
jgi:hypothetical protein